jgi:hypothetical protein
MHYLMLNQNVEVLKYVLDKCENMYITDLKRRKMTHYIAMNSNPMCIEYLISKGVDF